MSKARRNILRPAPSSSSIDGQRARRLQRLQVDMERTTAALARWQSKLRRACNAVERLQRKVSRLNRQLQQLHP